MAETLFKLCNELIRRTPGLLNIEAAGCTAVLRHCLQDLLGDLDLKVLFCHRGDSIRRFVPPMQSKHLIAKALADPFHPRPRVINTDKAKCYPPAICESKKHLNRLRHPVDFDADSPYYPGIEEHAIWEPQFGRRSKWKLDYITRQFPSDHANACIFSGTINYSGRRYGHGASSYEFSLRDCPL